MSVKQDTVKPQGLMWSFSLQHIVIFYDAMDSVTCFLYGMTYQHYTLSNVIQKALIADFSSEPGSHQAGE